MSGALSIPFLILGFFNAFSQKKLFVLLAFAALWVVVFRLAYRCVQLERRGNAINDNLADWLARLELRIQGIQQCGPGKYRQLGGDTKDEISLALVNEIQEFLENSVGHSQALFFTSTAGLQYSQTVGTRFCAPLHFHSNKSSLAAMHSTAQQTSDWQAAIDVLSLYATQLKEIIKHRESEH